MKTLLLMAVAVFTLGGCQPDETTVPAQPEQLVGEWQLVEPASPYQVTLKLGQDSASAFPFTYRLSGECAVNLYYGAFRYNNSGGLINPESRVGIFDLSATKRSGTPEAMQFEQIYFAGLRAVNRYELTNRNRLRLYYEGAQSGVLVYKKIN